MALSCVCRVKLLKNLFLVLLMTAMTPLRFNTYFKFIELGLQASNPLLLNVVVEQGEGQQSLTARGEQVKTQSKIGAVAVD
jgi:hypothetical protein